MNLLMVVLAIFAIAVGVIGFLEWLKARWKTMPAWLPWALSFIGNFALALVTSPLFGFSGWWWVTFGFLSLAVTELCYQTIVSGFQAIVQAAISDAQAKISPPEKASDPMKPSVSP